MGIEQKATLYEGHTIQLNGRIKAKSPTSGSAEQIMQE